MHQGPGTVDISPPARSPGGEETGAGRGIPIWLRLILLLIVVETFRVGVGLFNPELIRGAVPWPASPLNARFIASLYAAFGIAVLACATTRRYREVRIVLVGILVGTALIFFITLIRFFSHPGELAQLPLRWTVFYFIDPLLAGFALWRLGWRDGERSGNRAFAPLWTGHAVVFGLLGFILLTLPSVAIAAWPWTVTEPQAQLYSAFFIAIAVQSLLASRETQWEDVRWVALMMVLLAALVLMTSLLSLGRFRPSVSTFLWFALFLGQLLLFGALLARHWTSVWLKGGTLWTQG